MTFKEPLISIAAVLTGKAIEFVEENYEHLKNQETLDGMNLRELMIHISEKWIKPTFGSEFLGKQAVQRISVLQSTISGYARPRSIISLPEATVVFSDSGFEDEVAALLTLIEPANMFIIRVHREGHDYMNDSRRYLTAENSPKLAGAHFLDVENDGTEQGYTNAFLENVFMVMRSAHKEKVANGS